MKNKVLVNIRIPEIDRDFDIYLPLNKTIESIIVLLDKAISRNNKRDYFLTKKSILMDYETGIKYDGNSMIKDTDIRNGSRLILLS